MTAQSSQPEFRQIAHLSPDYDATVQLRHQLLRAPLGLKFDPAVLAAEDHDIHIAGFDESGKVVACLILSKTQEGTTLRMRQVAVAPELQRQGVGAQLVHCAESIATELGFPRLILHARREVAGFYLKLGYSEIGHPFTEVGIPHIAMGKLL
ncbi:MAG: GNAT family N-acetyltransferase [Verrucomicrobia bacterium]|nr:GNAT family N-acetyltransferase [Verrucomicrobiota bacterium]